MLTDKSETKQNRETKKEGAKRSNPASHYHRCAAAVAATTPTVVPVCLPACLSVCLPPETRRNRTEKQGRRERNVAIQPAITTAAPVSYTHLRAHETPEHLVCRLLLEKKKKKTHKPT